MLVDAKSFRYFFLFLFSLYNLCTPLQAANNSSRSLVSGALYQGANGIRVSPDGMLYVSSAVGSRIDVLEKDSGKLVRTLGPEQGILGPDDLAFAPNGQLYWTAFFSGDVMRLNGEGHAELVASLGPGVNAISFSANGRLFVSRVFLADELYEIDPQGLQPPRLIRKGMGGLNAMDFGPDGGLYGPLWFKGQIVRIDVDSGELTVIADGLDTAAAVKFSPDNTLHAIDQHKGEVLSIDIETGKSRVVAFPGLGADNLDFDAEGGIYITNAHEGGVSRVLPNGRVQALVKGGLSMPAGITVNKQGELVVAATQSLRIYDALTGAERNVQHASIGDPNTVATPLTVSPYGDKLLVSSWFSNTVQIWDPADGALQADYRDFNVPLNAVAVNDDLIVTELLGHRVVRRRAGTTEKEILMAGILVPTGLAAGNGELFVGDWVTGSIYQLMAGGIYLDVPQRVFVGLKHPEGMALDKQGRLLVVEVASKRLLRFDPKNPEIEVLATELAVGVPSIPGYPPSWLMSSVVVDHCGRITVTQDLGNSLLRVVPTDIVPGRCD